jgi:hypothetical protein
VGLGVELARVQMELVIHPWLWVLFHFSLLSGWKGESSLPGTGSSGMVTLGGEETWGMGKAKKWEWLPGGPTGIATHSRKGPTCFPYVTLSLVHTVLTSCSCPTPSFLPGLPVCASRGAPASGLGLGGKAAFRAGSPFLALQLCSLYFTLNSAHSVVKILGHSLLSILSHLEQHYKDLVSLFVSPYHVCLCLRAELLACYWCASQQDSRVPNHHHLKLNTR